MFAVFAFQIKAGSVNNIENDTMKLAVKEAKLTGLWTDFDFKIGPELKFPGLSRNGPRTRERGGIGTDLKHRFRAWGPFLESPDN